MTLSPERLSALMFFYALVSGLVIQLLLIPGTSFNAGDGLLHGGDWVYFHVLAVEMAEAITRDGWHNWTLKPEGQAPAGAAAFIYAVTGISQPWTVLPLNAVLYSVIGLCLYRMSTAISHNRSIGLASVLPLCFFPSLAMVYGQIHKDIWAIAGVLCVLSCWVTAITYPSVRLKHLLLFTMVLAVGNGFVFMVRPYALQISLFGQGAMFGLLLLGWPYHRRVFAVATGAVAIAISGLFFLTTLSHSVEEVPEASLCVPWEQTLPIASLDRILARVACTRQQMSYAYPDAGSNIDNEVQFFSASDMVLYAPRATQVALFSPFPTHWMEDVSTTTSKEALIYSEHPVL